jgi:hypothetical protein
MMRSRTKWGLAVASGLVAITLFSLFFVAAFGDTIEDIWPDARDREAIWLGALSGRLQAYARDHRSLPDSLEDLGRDVRRLDEWATPIRYSHRGPVLTLRSAGPDRVFDTIDDIEERAGTTYESKRALSLEDSARQASRPPI